MLSLGSSLWLDPVECIDILPINKITMVKFSLREDMLKNKHAVQNPDHIPNLRKLCSKAGIETGLYLPTRGPDQQGLRGSMMATLVY